MSCGGARTARCGGSSGGGGLAGLAVVGSAVPFGVGAVTVGGGGLDLAVMVDPVAGGVK